MHKLLIALVSVCWMGSSWAQASSQPGVSIAATRGPDTLANSTDPQVSLPGTRSFILHNAQGSEYRILVSEPPDPVAPKNGYPVLVVLDANSVFAAFSDALRLQRTEFGKAMIVGVGYPTDQPFDFHRRSYDFSPPLPAGQAPEPGSPKLGGHDELLDFLQHKLQPEIARRYPVDPNRLSLYGHSFGGMFALHALFTRPELFSHYVSASPSLWWQDRYLLNEERVFMQRAQAGQLSLVHTRLLLIAGGRETPHTTREAAALSTRLQPLSALGLSVSYETLPDETHMSMPVASVTQVLREVFTTRRR
jgi:predicted alpha/beta superfamily hydrolase